jgi:hypothetical protein
MIERRRLFREGDLVLGMPISPVPATSVQFARVFQSATGIIVFSQLAIATSTGAEKLMEYVEAL